MNRREFLSTLAAAICTPVVGKAVTVERVPWSGLARDCAIPYIFWSGAGETIVLPADFLVQTIGIELSAEMLYSEMESLLNECYVEVRLNKVTYFEGPLSHCYGRIDLQGGMLGRAGSEIELRSNLPGPLFLVHGLLKVA